MNEPDRVSALALVPGRPAPVPLLTSELEPVETEPLTDRVVAAPGSIGDFLNGQTRIALCAQPVAILMNRNTVDHQCALTRHLRLVTAAAQANCLCHGLPTVSRQHSVVLGKCDPLPVSKCQFVDGLNSFLENVRDVTGRELARR